MTDDERARHGRESIAKLGREVQMRTNEEAYALAQAAADEISKNKQLQRDLPEWYKRYRDQIEQHGG